MGTQEQVLDVARRARQAAAELAPLSRAAKDAALHAIADALDAQAPYWHDPRQTLYKNEVRQFVFDEESPRSFYVYPGNDGTGKVEAVLSELPAVIAASGDPTLLASYGQDIGLQDVYLSAILDFVLFRAMSKDDDAGNPAGAVAHYQAFATAVGLKTQVEGANSPNARPGVSGT